MLEIDGSGRRKQHLRIVLGRATLVAVVQFPVSGAGSKCLRSM